MSKKPSGFFGLLDASLKIQFLVISLPCYAIKNGSEIVILKKAVWIEFLIATAGTLTEIGAMIQLYKYTKNISVYNILHVLTRSSSFVFGMITTVEIISKIGEIKKTLEDLKALDGIISLEKKNLKSLKLRLVIWILILLSAILINTAIIISYEYKFYVSFILIFSNLRLSLQPFAVQIQLFLLMFIVRYYLEWVEKQLKQVVLKFTPENCIAPFFCRNGCEAADEIERIRKQYERINDLKTSINNIFSLRIWLDTLSAAIQYTCFIYFGIIQLKNNPGLEDTNVKIDLYNLIYQVVVLSLILYQKFQISSKVAEGGRNIGLVLHTIFSRSYCKRVNNELTMFSLELLHRDPNVKAFKFFVVDNKLICEVMSGIIMVIIALMQFESAGTREENEALNEFITEN